jgi:hypothetical protein
MTLISVLLLRNVSFALRNVLLGFLQMSELHGEVHATA